MKRAVHGARSSSVASPRTASSPQNSGSGHRFTTYPSEPFDELIGTTEFRVHEHPHITVDASVCDGCSTRECIVVCPANLFVPTADGGILFNYEQCFECGTCYLVCNREGAITWSYPVGGYGVVFHRS